MGCAVADQNSVREDLLFASSSFPALRFGLGDRTRVSFGVLPLVHVNMLGADLEIAIFAVADKVLLGILGARKQIVLSACWGRRGRGLAAL